MGKLFLSNLHDKENKNWQTSQKYFQCSVLGIMDIIQKEPSLENLITLPTVLCRACHRLPADKIETYHVVTPHPYKIHPCTKPNEEGSMVLIDFVVQLAAYITPNGLSKIEWVILCENIFNQPSFPNRKS